MAAEEDEGEEDEDEDEEEKRRHVAAGRGGGGRTIGPVEMATWRPGEDAVKASTERDVRARQAASAVAEIFVMTGVLIEKIAVL